MKKWKFRVPGILSVLLIVVYFLLIPALAHVTILESGGRSPDKAIPTLNPEISKVRYKKLPQGISYTTVSRCMKEKE